ncbi:MAG: hypothetical protein HY814_06740 [Candidatus Riflebacteria bacterium]|nr:hypothetical protein [Candidatus Riflebacteria bacterium]
MRTLSGRPLSRREAAGGGPRPRRFLLDGMLGRLAQWLRLMGFDAEYRPGARLAQLRREAILDDRLLLTCRRIPSVPWALRLEESRWPEQLARVVALLAIRAEELRPLSRCSLCNAAVLPVEAALLEGAVPPAVLERHQAFFRCPRCRHVYWAGSHAERIGRVLSALLNPAPRSADE